MESNSNSGFIIGDSLPELRITEYGQRIDKGFYCLCKVNKFGKWFFLKGLQPEYAELTTYKEFLKKEFELEIQLDHPNIVRAISLEHDERFGVCFLMEYVDGWTLNEFLQTNPSRKARKKICREILSAMSYFHSLQIIHRDLKPQNILITRKGNNVKIIDFGLSDSDTYAIFKQAAGSDGFAAPEQINDAQNVDLRCDIYAFGKLLKLLFPHRYWFIKRKCTKNDKEKRFNNADEIVARLRLRKILLILIPIFICTIGIIYSEVTLFNENQNLKERKIVDTVFVYDKDTIFIHSIDTIVTDISTQKQQNKTNEIKEKVEQLAKPIIQNLQNGKYCTQHEALNDITQFRISIRNILQSKKFQSDSQATTILTAIYTQYETQFQSYVEKLPAY